MKKLFTIFSLLFVFGISNAQVELWLGPKAGVNIANVSDMDGKSLTGIYGGAAFAVKFNERYTLQPELGFSMQGTKDVYNSNDEVKLNYFTIGVINKLYLVEGLHVLAGPEFNIKMNDTWSDFIYEDENGDWEAYDDGIQPFDFAIVGGLGYDLPFGLTFEARYKQGLLDVVDFWSLDNDSNSRLNQVFQIGIAYKFQLNK